ncbi:MAG: GNAT family N-acetyltransferase [Butyrivibrio sp.]|nr:GNAT family N-acetyltransferase [Butyrivibrio sp.]
MNFTFEEKKIENEAELYEISAFCGERKIGQLVYRKRERARIYSIEISSEMRRQETGSRLVHHLVQIAKANGCNMVEVMLENPTEMKREFYERNGFELSYFLWRCGLSPVFEDENRIHYCLYLNQETEKKESDIRKLQEWVLSSYPQNEIEESVDDQEDDVLSNQNYLFDVDKVGKDDKNGREVLMSEERFLRFAAPIEMELLKNTDLICGNCIYRSSDRNVMACYKYADKPYEVLTDDECEFYID